MILDLDPTIYICAAHTGGEGESSNVCTYVRVLLLLMVFFLVEMNNLLNNLLNTSAEQSFKQSAA
jgi:hypothetical protein